MNIYCYDETTKEYLMTRKADADPEETRIQGRFIPLVPANATLIAIPEYRENEIPVFENGQWTIKPDYRKNFYKVDESFNVWEIETIGEQEGFYVVDRSTGEEIKQTPDKFKIVDDEIVKKSDEEYETEQAQRKAEYQIEEIKTELYNLDLDAIRPLRAILAGTNSYEDLEKLKSIEDKVVALREELSTLQ